MIELSSALTSTFEEMILADVENMNDMTVHSIGYPIEMPETCGNNNNNTPENSLVCDCGYPTHQVGIDVTSFSGDNVSWKGDAMIGHPGSPVNPCVGGTCEDGEVGRVDIIWGGWNGLYERWTGSKVGPTKSFYEGIIDD